MNKEIYEINSKTCALIQENIKTTKIIDDQNEKIIHTPINQIINNNCIYNGSSLKGRLESTKYNLGNKYKLPIVVEETKEIILFPTTSSKSDHCTWISLHNIDSYIDHKTYITVYFKNNQKLDIKISSESFEKQILRATRLLLILKNRKNS